jgi:hypothetical protein
MLMIMQQTTLLWILYTLKWHTETLSVPFIIIDNGFLGCNKNQSDMLFTQANLKGFIFSLELYSVDIQTLYNRTAKI